MRAAVAESRDIEPAAVDGWPIGRRCCATTPWRAGWWDRIGYRDEAYLRIMELTGAQDLSDPDGDDAPDRLFPVAVCPQSPSRASVGQGAGPDRPAIAVVTL